MAEPQRIPVAELTHMLSALGEAKARDVVQRAAKALRIQGSELASDQALLVLEAIAAEPGLVGITARFAKARAILRWARSDSK